MADLIDLDAQKRKSFNPWKLWDRFTITGQDGSPYLVRLTIVGTPWFALMHHTFLRSDADRCLHDHPWPFASLVLSGGYFEESEWVSPEGEGRRKRTLEWRRPGAVLFRRATHRHRVLLPDADWSPTGPWTDREPVPARTLVLRLRKTRTWGFWTPDGWRRWTEFVQRKNAGEAQC